MMGGARPSTLTSHAVLRVAFTLPYYRLRAGDNQLLADLTLANAANCLPRTPDTYVTCQSRTPLCLYSKSQNKHSIFNFTTDYIVSDHLETLMGVNTSLASNGCRCFHFFLNLDITGGIIRRP
ncbi:hypothetical protein J6590_033316 [Homalodisca vitripennis]|nr:hypothetical protein J6590_033316 [Homalodisca vitripennis]